MTREGPTFQTRTGWPLTFIRNHRVFHPRLLRDGIIMLESSISCWAITCSIKTSWKVDMFTAVSGCKTIISLSDRLFLPSKQQVSDLFPSKLNQPFSPLKSSVFPPWKSTESKAHHVMSGMVGEQHMTGLHLKRAVKRVQRWRDTEPFLLSLLEITWGYL